MSLDISVNNVQSEYVKKIENMLIKKTDAPHSQSRWTPSSTLTIELLCLCLTTQCLKLNFHWVLVMRMSFSELM